MVGFQPPLSGILVTLILCVPGSLFENEHIYNDAGDDIIHAYVRLISDMNPNIKL